MTYLPNGHTIHISSGKSQQWDAATWVWVSVFVEGDDTKTYTLEGSLNSKDWATVTADSGSASFNLESDPQIFNIAKYRLIRLSLNTDSTAHLLYYSL